MTITRLDTPTDRAAPAPVHPDAEAGTPPAASRELTVVAASEPSPAARRLAASAAIRQVLLHVTPDRHPGQQLAVGVDVAARFGAKLVALYPVPRTRVLQRVLAPARAAAPAEPATERQTAAERLRRVSDFARGILLQRLLVPDSRVAAAAVEAESAEARGTFDRLSRMAEARAALSGMTRPTRMELEWHAAEGDAGVLLSRVGRLHDLVVAPAGDPPCRPGFPDPGASATARAALSCGRPVRAVPRGWQTPCVGRHVVVAWDSTREAALAARAALPFLATAESVTVLATSDRLPLDADGVSAFCPSDFLWQHGIGASVQPFETRGAALAGALLDFAAAAGADLAVSGAVGSWPARPWSVRDWRLAAFTRALLSEARVPLLLCH